MAGTPSQNKYLYLSLITFLMRVQQTASWLFAPIIANLYLYVCFGDSDGFPQTCCDREMLERHRRRQCGLMVPFPSAIITHIHL